MNTLPASPDDLFEDDLGGSSNAVNPLMIVHRALRGRYVLAIALGVLLALPLGAVGYIAMPPEYTSRAVLEANMTLPKVMYETDMNESMPAFEAFVSQQASTLQSERVLRYAVDNPDLQAQGWPKAPAGLIRLNDGIQVLTPSRANLIILSVTDRNPKAAQVATTAVLKSYTTIRDEQERLMYGPRQRQLEDLRDQYLRERDDKRKRALDLALTAAGTEDIEIVQRTKLEEIDDIEDQIRELTTILALMKSSDEANGIGSGETRNAPAADGGEAEETAESVPDPKRHEGEDDKLDRLIDERGLLRRQLDALLLNATPAHRQAKRLSREILVLDTEIEARVVELDRIAASAPLLKPDGSSKPEIEARLADLERQRDRTKSDLAQIARSRLEVFALKQQAELANNRLEEAEQRIESLRVEKDAQIKGRIRISQEPEHPLQPSTDRRLPLAGAGLVGGFGTGVALVAAFGLAFPRVRVADDVTAGRGDFAMLGMIPVFPEEGDGEAALNVRESFHFLRVILDARRGQGGLVCGVTSPTSGDGKTTIALRLAQSYAAARRKVLLVDADLVGRGATRSMGLSNSLGLDGENDTLDEVVHTLDDLGFDMIPASNAEHASEIFCGHTLQRILREAKDRYDIVLVDTGPILGSIEAAAIAPSMDQILLVISRGLESRLLRMATDRLRELGARSVGIIFNKATTVDFNRSFAPPSSTSRRSVQRGVTTANLADTRETMMSSVDRDTDR